VGVATGSALGGVAIDAGGAHGAILVSTGLLIIAAVCAAVTIRWIPDLKGRTVEPPPETGTLSLPLP
jgi:predicted MFS family arabinose efflux permease